MFCAISGKPPRSPVLSPQSKCIFEKQLIEQYIADEGKDPITNGPLRVDELIEVSQRPEQSSLADSLNSATLNANYSIPNLLSTLQNEWDAIMLENFKLRKRLDDCTKKLSVALYERDAAKIVAARALKASDDIKHEMNRLISRIGDAEESASTENEASLGSSSQLSDRLLQESSSYMKKTKKVASKFNASSLAPFALGDRWNVSQSLTLHRSTSLRHEFQQTIVFQLESISEICHLQGPLSHRIAAVPLGERVEYLKAASHDSILFANEGYLGVSGAGSEPVQTAEGKIGKIIFMENHEEILNDHFLWADETGKVGFTTLDCKATTTLIEGSETDRYFQAAYHKDGLLLALVNHGTIKICDLSRPMDLPTNFEVGKEVDIDGEIKEVRFSSNGYWMIVHCGDSLLSFDLRKSPGTLAVNPIELKSKDDKVLWDLDVSSKHLALLKQRDQQCDLQFFSFQKSKKAWELMDGKTFSLETSDQEVDDFLMLYTKEGPAVVLQTPDQVDLYTT